MNYQPSQRPPNILSRALKHIVTFLLVLWRKPMGKALIGVVVIIAVLGGIKTWQIRAMVSGGEQGMPPTTVTSAEVKQENWPPLLSAIGSISPVQGATISSELAGTVAEVGFESGAVVKKGDLLVRLDISAEEAQLRTAEADLEWARSDLQRNRDLAARKVISKAELDAAESKFKQKEGTVDNMRAMIGKKTMRAPFDGIAGIRVVNVGQMVNAGQQIVPLQSLDPVYVDFALPEQRLAELSNGLEVNVRADAFPGRQFRGTLTAINSAVDVATRNISLQGTLPNPDRALRPGMFAKVDVVLPQKKPVLVIPATAVSYAPYGDSVFVIEKKKDEKTKTESQIIRQQFIRTGETRGDFVTVTKGLKPGETVVSSGVFKLRNGMPVVINNQLAPKPELEPKPAQT
jgi:membrane fusion protein (multidrug efflux system)